MRRGETKRLAINLHSDVSRLKTIQVVLKQGYATEIKIADSQIERKGTQILFDITQEQSLSFSVGKVKVQVRAVDRNSNAFASNVMCLKIDETLDDEVIV